MMHTAWDPSPTIEDLTDRLRARTMLDEVARLAEGPVAESFAESDRHPPTFAQTAELAR